MASIKAPNSEAPHRATLDPEQHALLLSFGLTERDLNYMGPRQRQLVKEVLDRQGRSEAAA